eukprot:tig00001107_g7103.t1
MRGVGSARIRRPSPLPPRVAVWKYIEAGQYVASEKAAEFNRRCNEARDLFTKNRLTQKNSADRIYRLQRAVFGPASAKKAQVGVESPSGAKAKTPEEAARRATSFFSELQDDDGHWPADYGGPMFLLPGLVFTCYISKTELSAAQKSEMIRYLTNHQNADGGWGTHIESKSTMFGSTLNYVALRVLGVPKDDPRAIAGRNFLKSQGGAVGAPSWAKFWLAAMNLYDWNGLNPITPELWLLPYWAPVCPGRMWCHCRVVYLPMAYVYGARAVPPLDELLLSLREEIHAEPYEQIRWSSLRDNCHPNDTYTKQSWVLKITNRLTVLYEKIYIPWLRRRALKCCIDHIQSEDRNTKYICIGPVNKTMNMLSIFHEFGECEALERHRERLADYLWLAEDGMKMQGYNGSQLWDCAFAVQAMITTGLTAELQETLAKAYMYIDTSQVREDVPEMAKYYRHISNGAWPFSTIDHGWPISDCTAEGLKATLMLHKLPYIKKSRRISDERLFDAVNVILSLQSVDGGWATYEQRRGSYLLELINPSEVFGEIMVDYPCVECTSACVTALSAFMKDYPEHRAKELKKAVQRGVRFIKQIQRKDGSWMGSWAVCFTYGAWFGVSGLVAAGESLDSPAIRKACQYLVDRQRPDGGWGECYLSCVEKKYVQNPERSQVVDTAWALIALMTAHWHDPAPVKKGIQFLVESQLANGDWPQQGISGVFNRNCMITYTTYRNTFPTWAIGLYTNHYSKNH